MIDGKIYLFEIFGYDIFLISYKNLFFEIGFEMKI